MDCTFVCLQISKKKYPTKTTKNPCQFIYFGIIYFGISHTIVTRPNAVLWHSLTLHKRYRLKSCEIAYKFTLMLLMQNIQFIIKKNKYQGNLEFLPIIN